MAKPDGRIEKGQRIASAISARAWNRAQDAADIVLGVRPGIAAGATYRQPLATVIDAQWTGHALNQFEIVPVRIDDHLAIWMALDETNIRSVPPLGAAYSFAVFGSPMLGIVQEPVAAGTRVPCKIAVAGLSLARVTLTPGVLVNNAPFCGLRTFNFATNQSFTFLQKHFALQQTPVGPIRIVRLFHAPDSTNKHLTLEGDIERNDPGESITVWALVQL